MTVPVVAYQPSPGKLAAQQIFQTSEGRLGFGVTNPQAPIHATTPNTVSIVAIFSDGVGETSWTVNGLPALVVIERVSLAANSYQLGFIDENVGRVGIRQTADNEIVVAFANTSDVLIGEVGLLPYGGVSFGNDLGIYRSGNTINIGDVTDPTNPQNNPTPYLSADRTSGWISIGNVLSITSVVEDVSLVGAGLGSAINIDIVPRGVVYYTANATAVWDVNFRGNSTTTVHQVLSVGDSVTVALLGTQGGTSYYANTHSIDGTPVVVLWTGGTAPIAGVPGGVDVYTYTIIKMSETPDYVVLASRQTFAEPPGPSESSSPSSSESSSPSPSPSA